MVLYGITYGSAEGDTDTDAGTGSDIDGDEDACRNLSVLPAAACCSGIRS